MDNLSGTAANDTFISAANGAAVGSGTTLNSGDVVNGGAGIDTLKIVATAATGPVVPALSNVENIDIQAFANGLNLNLANSTGVEKISLSTGNGNATVSNVANLVDLEFNNTTSGTVTLGYAASVVAGTADEQNLALNSAVGGVLLTGIETLNVTSTGAEATVNENRLAIVSNDVKSVNIDGSGHLNLNFALTSNIKTVDASASTGGVDVTFGAAADVTATGGSGDDTFNFGGTLNVDDVVDGGAGFDAVGLNGGNYSTAAAAKGINGLVSIEELVFTGGATTINHATLTNADVEAVSFDLNAAANVDNALSAVDYKFNDDANGLATFNMQGGNTTLNVELAATDAANTDDAKVNGLTIGLSGVDVGAKATINLSSTGDLFAGQVNGTGVITAVQGSTVNITGDADLTINKFANAATVDASGFGGDLVMQGSDMGAGALAIADTITLGSGSDTVVVSASSSGFANVGGVLITDIINGFTAGEDGDVLDHAGFAGTYTKIDAGVQAAITALAGPGATVLAAAALAAADASVNWTAFDFQGSTYALYDADNNATFDQVADILVQITGITAADLVGFNFG